MNTERLNTTEIEPRLNDAIARLSDADLGALIVATACPPLGLPDPPLRLWLHASLLGEKCRRESMTAEVVPLQIDQWSPNHFVGAALWAFCLHGAVTSPGIERLAKLVHSLALGALAGLVCDLADAAGVNLDEPLPVKES